MSTNLSELSGRKGFKTNLFEALGIAAEKTGTPSKDRMEELAAEFLMGTANVFGAASFYEFFKRGEQGQKNFYLQWQCLNDRRYTG